MIGSWRRALRSPYVAIPSGLRGARGEGKAEFGDLTPQPRVSTLRVDDLPDARSSLGEGEPEGSLAHLAHVNFMSEVMLL